MIDIGPFYFAHFFSHQFSHQLSENFSDVISLFSRGSNDGLFSMFARNSPRSARSGAQRCRRREHAVACRKGHSRACHFGAIFDFSYKTSSQF
tara:strand:+ start:1027 stop:1305 length:279 start_codon:yes stop_codon:yes gene_type:complete